MGKLDSLNSVLKNAGFKLDRYNVGTDANLRRAATYKKYDVSLLIDVGANTGIYGKEMRELGYQNKIVSFEPLSDAFIKLKQNASKLGNWDVFNFALGNENTTIEINVSQNSHSSSILNILDEHTNAEATASYVGKQQIEVKTLDSISSGLDFATHKEVYLKIDTQGFEMNVLNGARESLKYINTIQLEMSLKPLYQGQALYDELFKFFWNNGYSLIDIDPGFADSKNGILLQFDATFRKA